jgi:nucleotide-binding universal stress UspA family protein
LAEFANEVDLLVLGSRRNRPLRRLILPGASARLARRARCPLVVVPRLESAPLV